MQSGAANPMAGTIGPTGEDCLFLDLTVPSKAIKDPSLKLPVVAWFYGGAYGKSSLDPVPRVKQILTSK